MSEYALGLIETAGLIGAIEAADAAAKAAAVAVAAAELTDATLVTIRIEGELGAVQAAVEAGTAAAEKVGQIVSVTVIPNPDDGLGPILPTRRFTSKYRPGDDRPPLHPPGRRPPPSPPGRGGEPTPPPARGGMPPVRRQPKGERPPGDLRAMTVSELRRMARNLERLELKGRQISRANKQQLISAIRRALDMD